MEKDCWFQAGSLFHVTEVFHFPEAFGHDPFAMSVKKSGKSAGNILRSASSKYQSCSETQVF